MHMTFTFGHAKSYTALATTELSATVLLKNKNLNNISMSIKIFYTSGVAAAVLQKVSSLTDSKSE